MSCVTPHITDLAYEGSWWLIVSAPGIDDGTTVTVNDTETGEFTGGDALIALSEPLLAGQTLKAVIDEEGCTAYSCAVAVSKLESRQMYCDFSPFDLPAGFLTGKMRCVGKDLYHLVADGEGGVYPGQIIQESCVICGGINPSCGDEPTLPRYWNVVRCSNGLTYQTSTELTAPNQRVTHPTFGEMRWDNTYVDTLNPANNIGVVTALFGQKGCSNGGGGGSGDVYFNIISCADGQTYQTTTVLSFPNQRVSHGTLGEFYWDGSTGSPVNNVGPVTPLGSTMCSGGGGGTVYYNIVSCAGGGVYQTETVITLNNQRVSTPMGEHVWDGTTSAEATHPRNSVIMHDIFGCS